jgi:hypothetical protein
VFPNKTHTVHKKVNDTKWNTVQNGTFVTRVYSNLYASARFHGPTLLGIVWISMELYHSTYCTKYLLVQNKMEVRTK